MFKIVKNAEGKFVLQNDSSTVKNDLKISGLTAGPLPTFYQEKVRPTIVGAYDKAVDLGIQNPTEESRKVNTAVGGMIENYFSRLTGGSPEEYRRNKGLAERIEKKTPLTAEEQKYVDKKSMEQTIAMAQLTGGVTDVSGGGLGLSGIQEAMNKEITPYERKMQKLTDDWKKALARGDTDRAEVLQNQAQRLINKQPIKDLGYVVKGGKTPVVSKVPTEQKLYHGTTAQGVEKLKPSGLVGSKGEATIPGVYLSEDYSTASYYARKDGIQINNPVETTFKGKLLEVENIDELKKALGLLDWDAGSRSKIPQLLDNKGYDGVKIKMGGERNEIIVTNARKLN